MEVVPKHAVYCNRLHTIDTITLSSRFDPGTFTLASLAAPTAVNFALNILNSVNNLIFSSNRITLWSDVIPDNIRAHLNPPRDVSVTVAMNRCT